MFLEKIWFFYRRKKKIMIFFTIWIIWEIQVFVLKTDFWNMSETREFRFENNFIIIFKACGVYVVEIAIMEKNN